jgi:hypothetical protein
MRPAARTRPRADLGWWLKHGIVGGVLAGITFLVFEMLVVAAMTGASGFWLPLRRIAALAIGAGALEPSYALGSAAGVGIMVHLLLAAAFGLMFALIASALRGVVAIPLASTVYGLGLWLVNFYLIAPVFGWYWFPNSNLLIQFVAHTFFYGTVLGLYLDWMAAGRRRAVAASRWT